MCDLPMSKQCLLCFRIQTKVRSMLYSSLSRIISLAPLVRYLIISFSLSASMLYSRFLVRPVDRVHVLGGLSPFPDGRIVVRFHFFSAFNALLLVNSFTVERNPFSFLS